MAEEPLKLYWDHFFKAETGTYEKSTWLDLFLAEFLLRLNGGANPKELINFCPVSGVVTLVGCELLCGIHRVTSSLSAHSSPKENDVTAPVEEKEDRPTSLFTKANSQSTGEVLRKYLLGGVAWRCLALLRALGVEGLSCCRQLSSVLIWLFGELSAGASTPAQPRPRGRRAPIHQLFSNRIWSKQKPAGSPASKMNNTVVSERSTTGRSRHVSQSKDADVKTKRKTLKQELSSESADSNDDLQVLNRSLAIKVSSPDDFEYFNSPLKSSNEYANELYSDPFHSPKKTKPKPDDYMTEKHREVINSEISAFEFILMITDLLQELCKAESSLSGSEGSQISMQCINFSLKNLCSLQFGSLPACSKSADEVSHIKVALTELLIVSLDKVLIRSDLCAKLINNGILPMLLRILEDVICKSSSKYHKKSDENLVDDTLTEAQSDYMLRFVFGIAYSITAFFHCLLMQCRSLDNLREFTDQFKLYGECLKGGLLKECVELMIRIRGVDYDETVTLIKKLLESVGKLINGMKRVRSEVVHSAACPRTRHKVCRARVAAGMHHHHDILGEPSTDLPLSSTCCVSVLYGTLACLLTDEEVSAQAPLRHKLLRVMLNCGVCCCFSPGLLMENIVRLMLTHDSVASKCLQVLEHTVYGDLGASVLIPKVTDQLPCSICEPSDDKRFAKKHCLHSVSPVDRKSVWSFLIHYNSLLQLDNHNNVLHATVSHLLRVTPKCRLEMKHELLFSVIYPTFIVAKHRYIIRMEDSAYFLTVSCLNIFSSLLNTVSFADQFIQKGGLSYVLELVSLPEFSNQCCSILEIAITVEIFKLIKENTNTNYYREMSSLASIQMLFKSLSETTQRCFKIYRLKLPEEKFDELSDVTEEKKQLLFIEKRRDSSQIRKVSISMPKAIKTNFAASENVIEESIDDYLEALKNAWTFWKSCAALCLYSPVFRQYVVDEDVFLDSFALLRVLLYFVRNCEIAPVEMRLLIKIVEALLTVQFAVSDVTSDRSKEASCAVVRAALHNADTDGSAALRALCEALVRVAVAEPSAAHAMPPPPPQAKVPPLLCPSGNSSVEGSSSEESVAVPYASEHSEPYYRADEGYEADVEVGKFDLLSTHKSRKVSESLSSLSSAIGTEPALGAACSQYAESGRLAHPELCVIVLDILTDLIHKLVSEPDGQDGARASGACLARACCTRLAAALGRARAPPPPLLGRLLGPKTAALLELNDPDLAELQRSILELIHVVAMRSISASELALLLRLCARRAALPALLPALLRLAGDAEPAPLAVLAFPVTQATDAGPLGRKDGFEDVSAPAHCAHAEAAARGLREAHLKAGLNSAWALHAARCGAEGAGWAPWLQGFALTTWLRRHPPYEPANECKGSERSLDAMEKDLNPELHVLTIGHDSLLLELWLHTDSGAFTLRLSRPETSCYKVLSETRVDAALPPAQWCCVALNVKEVVHKRKIHIQVTLYIDGCECETVSLPLQGILVRKVIPTYLLIGHSAAAPGVYHISGCCVYRAPVLGAAAALHAAAHEPAPHPHLKCKVDNEIPNYSRLLTPNVLDSNIDWDQVYDMSGAALRELNENLLLSFSAHAPNIVNLYHQTTPLPTVFSTRNPGPKPMAGACVPEPLACTWNVRWKVSGHCGIAPAVYMLGGPSVLLYLFARVVEMEASAEEQAMALGIVLRVCRADNRLRSALHGADGLELLLRVFGTPKCRLTRRMLQVKTEEQAMALGIVLRICRADNRLRSALHDADGLELLLRVFGMPKCRLTRRMLQVILEEACTSRVLTSTGAGLVVSGADAVVREPALLALLVQASRHLDTEEELEWEVEGERMRGSLWALTLCCIRSLLEDAAARRWRAFNQQQLHRHHLLRLLLAACKERFLNSEDNPSRSPDAAGACLVGVVGGLLGAPPLPCHLAELCDFLLLMHQASDTFVTHSRANFYFLLTADTQDTSEFMVKARRRDPEPEITNSGSLREEDSKLMKGIINMQIKEGRKHNISSTSENSDLNIEMSGDMIDPVVENEGGPDDALSGYIVVDVDDVAHTTVEMYSSGIYHEKRVRAGAAPGWTACEGLLLLLRDAILLLSEHDLAQAMQGAIQPEALVVLANHRDAGVRAAVLRVVGALQRRGVPALQPRTPQKTYLYRHLANQIALYPSSIELAAACAALVTKCDVPLEDQLEDDIWVDVSPEMLHCAAPLLATLPACLHDPPLAHNVSLLVRRIIDKGSLKLLSEMSVAEVSVRCIRDLGATAEFNGRALLLSDMGALLAKLAVKALESHHHMQLNIRVAEVAVRCISGLGATAEFNGRALLLSDMGALLAKLAVKALESHHHMQIITDMHHMLTYVELTADSENVSRAARAAQVSLFVAQLNHLDIASRARQKHNNYFTNVLSSAVSLGTEGISQTELEARHLATVTAAVNFLQARSPVLPLHSEGELVEQLLVMLIAAVSGGLPTRRAWWAGSGGDGWLRALRELVWWVGAPAPGARALQPHLLRALHAAPHVASMLKPPPPCRKLAVYLLLMLRHMHALADNGAAGVELAITDWARGWCVALQDGLENRLGAALQDEAAALLRVDEERWAKTAHNHNANIGKVIFSKESLAARLTESAMAATRAVVDAQNGERKAFMEVLRRSQSSGAVATRRWQRLADHLTHEQALWHEPESYPVSWELDGAEAPGRVRVRLRRAHLALKPRFLKPSHQHKPVLAEAAAYSTVHLRSITGDAGGFRGGLVARLQLHETVAHMARVTLVTVARERDGELLLTDRCIHFVPDSLGDAEGEEALSWALEDVRHVATRRWCLQERAAELFLAEGRAWLLAFAGNAERTAFLQHTAKHLPTRMEPETLSEAMNQWRNGTITNWEYLMKLNGLAGRTYNDLMQYPVLPFVIADYSSRILDLTDPATFRDLSKPMAIQNKSREQHYINTYNDLKAARREGCGALASREPHHYASLYSNPGCVLHYLVRLPPFTQLLLHYQDNNFDMPDRTFHSLATTWRLITNDSPTDVKELIPELYYLPELFHNDEGLNLGVRQCGACVDDVELPAWAADARLFTLVHRQALEAPLVTESLPHWIDLVFGYKQTGQAAIDAVNVFPHCTYYGFDPEMLSDEVDRTAAAAMVRTYGQAPRQLLRAPHPHRASDLAPTTDRQPQVWAGVEGARWGRYCGSPALGSARVALRRALGGARLAALPERAHAAAAAPPHNALLALPADHGDVSTNSSGDTCLALLSWGHSDGVVRLKRRRDAPLEPVLRVTPLDQITAVATSCTSASCPVVIGHASGRVLVLRPRRGGGAALRARSLALHAHDAHVTDAAVCVPAGLLVTASVDGKIVLWDLNKLTYIRTLPNRDMLPVTHVAISETLCDVASVHDVTAPTTSAPTADDDSYEKDAENYKSLIRVHTVNGRFVGSVKVAERVTCICYSNAPEGVSVNAIACGDRSGAVRFYSAWDLRPLGVLPAAHTAPAALGVVSLTYSLDSEILFGCYADGTCVAWHGGGARPAVQLLPAHALF
ncbi:lysosomal-trafficking regulator [Cydia amplana]|uniref:lysosomal-trafficking regulator n=1 Tax=Cydia amplana TaxID=1869771 RepID=UPI002FE5A5F2